MAAPQEVIEMSMPHPADSTPQSRQAASARVLRALAANDYGFVRRPRPISDMEDGQCPTCKCEMVHVDHGVAYNDALERMASMQQQMLSMQQRLLIMHAALHDISTGDTADPAACARGALP